MTERELELSFRLSVQINRLVSQKVGTDTFKVRAFFEAHNLLRDRYRLHKLGYNPQYHKLCSIADALQVSIKDLFSFDESEEFRKVGAFVISSESPQWKKYKKKGKIPWKV